MAAVKALTTGSKWQWNPAAFTKEKTDQEKEDREAGNALTVGPHGGRCRAAKAAHTQDLKT